MSDDRPQRRATDHTFWDRHRKGIRISLAFSVPACVVTTVSLVFWAGQQSQVLQQLLVDSATHARLLEEKRTFETDLTVLKAESATRTKARDDQITNLQVQINALNNRVGTVEQRMYDRIDRQRP